MVEDELVRQKAQELGITVSDADVDAQINKMLRLRSGNRRCRTDGDAFTDAISRRRRSSRQHLRLCQRHRRHARLQRYDVTPTLTPFPSATPSPTPNATEEATQFSKTRDDFFTTIRSPPGVSDADIREYFRMQALRDKVRDAVITDV